MKHWHTQDGRDLLISEIDLEHLLNIVHDTNFRVARMRQNGLAALGGDNRNVNDATKTAFLLAQPADIFPAWKAIVKRTKQKFHGEFGFTLFEVRNAVYDAWLTGNEPHIRWADAIRFCLSAKRRAGVAPPRLSAYLATFPICDKVEFARMCWNLRVDQPMARDLIRASAGPFAQKVMHKLPETSNHSALKFTKPSQMNLGMMDNWDMFL